MQKPVQHTYLINVHTTPLEQFIVYIRFFLRMHFYAKKSFNTSCYLDFM